MENLVEVMKQLPSNLKIFFIDLSWNQLGKYSENIKLLGEGLK